MITVLDGYFRSLLDRHVEDVLAGEFVEFKDGEKTFKGFQKRGDDIVSSAVSVLFPFMDIVENFVRKSPKGQVEPNFIHNDRDHADVTVILYLNKIHPENAGTSLYDTNGEKMVEFRMKFGRMVAFPSGIDHSRNIKENFGEGNDARLVQVLFLKNKET